MAKPAAVKQCGWFVVDGRPVASPKQLRVAILAYRRQARRRVAEQIWTIEDDLCRELTAIMPLQARLTRKRGVSVYGREDKERLREVIADTRPRAFVLRHRCGGKVYARTPFWSHRPTACGIDELHDALGCHEETLKEGQRNHFDTFVERLNQLRQLRRSYCGMIKNGLAPEAIWSDYPEEAWLDLCILPDDVDSAIERVTKEVARCSVPTGSQADRLFARRWFDELLENGDDAAYAQMLESEVQVFWEALGAPKILGWRRLVAMVCGLPDNTEEVIPDVGVTRLAAIIPVRRRQVRRPRSLPAAAAS